MIELFESKHTADLADRHAQSIQQLCSEMNNELAQEGFFYEELDKVCQVLRLILNGLNNEKVSPTRCHPPKLSLTILHVCICSLNFAQR